MATGKVEKVDNCDCDDLVTRVILVEHKLDTTISELKTINSKMDLLLNPDSGLYPRVHSLEEFKKRQEDKDKNMSKNFWAAFGAICLAIATSVWNVLVTWKK